MHRKKISPRIKKIVFARAQNRCEYCQWWRDFAIAPFNCEHILPLARGGTDDLINFNLNHQQKSHQPSSYPSS